MNQATREYVQRKLDTHLVPEPMSGCWLWPRSVDASGYGKVGVPGGGWDRAHRLSYQVHVGPIPPGLFVLHKCDTPACANPDHLYAGTKSENAWDRERRGRGNHPSGDDHAARRIPGMHAGTKNGRSKLTPELVRELRSMRASGVPVKDLSKKFGICDVAVYDIVNRKLWKDVH